jgi:hypothetical protein
LEVQDRFSQRAIDATPKKELVIDAPKPGPRLVFDDNAIDEPAVARSEVTLVMEIGRPALDALVLDEPILVEATQGHMKFDVSTEQPDHDPGLVACGAPLRSGFDPYETGPVAWPVGYVRDKREPSLDRYRKTVSALDPDHLIT